MVGNRASGTKTYNPNHITDEKIQPPNYTIMIMKALNPTETFLIQYRLPNHSYSLEYLTFYLTLNGLAGKQISIKGKTLFVGLGGGATYYYSAFPVTTYDLSVVLANNSEERTFHAEIHCPEARILPFA